MSRNFDLLSQIELEAASADRPQRPSSNHPLTGSVLPKRSFARGDETFRMVQRMFLSANGRSPRQVVFCGVDAENSSSSVCASVGRVLATNSSAPVCLLDGNMGSPRLSNMFCADAELAFSDKSASIRDKCLQIDANLWLGGADWLIDNNGSLLSATRLRDSFGQLRRVFDYLLIDAPSMSASGDAGILGQAADAVVLVIEANGTRRLTARKAKEDLEAAGVRLLGTVLYNRTFPIPEEIYKRL